MPPPKQAQGSTSSQGVAAGVNVKALEIGRHTPSPSSQLYLLLHSLLQAGLHHGFAQSKHMEDQPQSWVCARASSAEGGL